MSYYYEIAHAALSQRLCLFVGTGFSKALTNNSAPGWRELMVQICHSLPDGTALSESILPEKGGALTLEEAAQVIDLQLSKYGRDIHNEIASLIAPLSPAWNTPKTIEFLNNFEFQVITTNYDKLIEQIVGPDRSLSISPGFPIPRHNSAVNVFHIHGSVDSPKNMVVTSSDYFEFINRESYFSRKLNTVLHENTVVILGYSLGDTNLKAILNDYRQFSKSNSIGANIFFVARSKIDQFTKDYYAHCYGIRVLDLLELERFCEAILQYVPLAKATQLTFEQIKEVQIGKASYTDDYLKMSNSFFEIIALLTKHGTNFNSQETVAMLATIIAAKRTFTTQLSAWDQYAHLAEWLCHLGSILELPGTAVENEYIQATDVSMRNMSQSKWGHSWQAYRTWEDRWSGILPVNRNMIRKYVQANVFTDEIDAIVLKA